MHSCTYWLRSRNPPPPLIWAHIRGRAIGQARQTTSLCDPLLALYCSKNKEEKCRITVTLQATGYDFLFLVTLETARYSPLSSIAFFGCLFSFGMSY